MACTKQQSCSCNRINILNILFGLLKGPIFETESEMHTSICVRLQFSKVMQEQ